MVNKKAKKRGGAFAPHTRYAIKRNEESSRWIASICIGDIYFETDPYKDKEGAVSELIGYLEALNESVEEKINDLNDILYGREDSKRNLRQSQGGTDAG